MKFPAICEYDNFWWEDWAMPPVVTRGECYGAETTINLFLFDGTWSAGKKKDGWQYHTYNHTYNLDEPIFPQMRPRTK